MHAIQAIFYEDHDIDFFKTKLLPHAQCLILT